MRHWELVQGWLAEKWSADQATAQAAASSGEKPDVDSSVDDQFDNMLAKLGQLRFSYAALER
eukprot:8938917-Pyramimonas_sp.AAC.1